MEPKNKLYLINGSDVLLTLLNQENEKWHIDIKLLRNLDRAINYFIENLDNHFRLHEPSSQAIILIDKPIREFSKSSRIKIKLISEHEFLEELKFQLKTTRGADYIYIVSERYYSTQIHELKNIEFIKPKEFLYSVLGQFETYNLISSKLTAEINEVDKERLKSIPSRKEFLVNKLKVPNLSLNMDNIELNKIKDAYFAIHFAGKNFPLINASQYVNIRSIIYVGYTLEGGAIKRLLMDDSSKSNVRQLLGLLLLDKELKQYEIIKTSSTEFKFDFKSELKITDWIKNNLKIAYVDKVRALLNNFPNSIQLFKNEIIKEFSPILNLSNNSNNPYGYEIKQLLKRVKESKSSDDRVNQQERMLRLDGNFLEDEQQKTRFQNSLRNINILLRDFDVMDFQTQREILSEINNYPNLFKLLRFYYSTESRSHQREFLDIISEKEEKTVKEEWERIIDEMAHSINTDVYAALSYINRNLENDLVKKASYNIQQIRDLTNLIMWYLKRNKLQLSGSMQSVSIEEVIKTQIETIKAGIHTLRLATAQHRDALFSMIVNINKDGPCIIQIDMDLINAIDLIFKDVLRNAFKNTDENEPSVTIYMDDNFNNLGVKVSNNLVISQEELNWFNNNIESDELAMSKSSKVGFRIVKKWTQFLNIYTRMTIDKNKKETTFHLTIPKEVKVEKSA